MDGLVSSPCCVLVQGCLYLVLLDCAQSIALQVGAKVCLWNRFVLDDGDFGRHGLVLL
jgi:hypothetical protein